jgi:ribosomal protein L5
MMHYHSMVGTVLMGDDGLLNEMPLCTIDDLVVQAGFRGKVTVQVILLAMARAKIQDVTQMKPIMMATA